MKNTHLHMLIRTLIASGSLLSAAAFAQDVREDDDVRPSPPSIGADIPVTYFGPPPSSVEPELIGPLTLLNSGTLNEDAGYITLPLYKGFLKQSSENPDVRGESVWYILTDTTDAAAAIALGLNHAGKLAFAENGRAVRDAETTGDGEVLFHWGSVDFSPEHIVVPSPAPNFFPPADGTQPGSVGDELYSPLMKLLTGGDHIYNAPMVSFDTTEEQLNAYCGGIPDAELAAAREILHDGVVSICPDEGTVTIELVSGFSFAKPVFYMSTETNDPLAAALEKATFAPGLRDVLVGNDDSFLSAVERLFAWTNGPVNVRDADDNVIQFNPQRQGFNSALSDGGGPLNVLGGIPTIATDYSPLWDVNIGEWTQDAVNKGYVTRLTEEFQILGYVERGFITAPGGGTYGSSGLIVNCPIVHRFL